MKKKLTLISIILVLFCILIGNIPSSISYTPTTNLDANEQYKNTSIWSFYYGHSSAYGPYIRDVQWAGLGSKDRYIGMANIPYVYIAGSPEDLASATPTSGPSIYTIGTEHYLISTGFTITVPGATYSITVNYELADRPAYSDAFIDIFVDFIGSGGLMSFGMASRVDYDIDGLSTPGNDEAYLYKIPQSPQWQQETTEVTFTDGNPRDTTRNFNGGLKVKQIDATTSGPWGAIEPRSWDIIIIAKFESDEYTSYYVGDQEDIDPEDIVIWTETNLEEYPAYWDPMFPSIPATVRNVAWIF